MKTKLILAVLALVCAFTLSATPQSKSVQWEYKFENDIREKKANELAAEGWELVTVGSTGTGNTMTFVFKRSK